MEDKDIKDLVSKLSGLVNPFNFEHEKFTQAVLNEHRTLQQSIFRLFIKTISQWAKLQENHYDLRNEYTVLTSRKIMKELEEDDGVPFI